MVVYIMDIYEYILSTYTIHHPETFIIIPILFAIYLFVLSEKSILKRVYITTLYFCLSASLFGVLWWYIYPKSIPEQNISFYSLLTICSLIVIYVNNRTLHFFKLNRLLLILIPLLLISTYLRYCVPGNDYGWVWIFNRIMEFSIWLGFIKTKGDLNT